MGKALVNWVSSRHLQCKASSGWKGLFRRSSSFRGFSEHCSCSRHCNLDCSKKLTKSHLQSTMPFPEGSSFRSSSLPDPFSREALQPAADYILVKAKAGGHAPTLGIICGSGLGELAAMLERPVVLPCADIPGFPVSTAPGHQGKLMIGRLSGMTVILMQGRLHAYEGHPLWKVTMPVRVMRMVGANTLVVTNAVGSINPQYQVGDIMLVCDHINMFGLAGNSP